MSEHVRMVRLSDLQEWDRNPHKHPDSQLQTLASGMRRFGFTSLPVLATYPGERVGFVSSGNGRLAALRLLRGQYPSNPPPGIDLDTDGDWLIPVRPMAYPSKGEAEAQGLSDNWIASMPGVEDDAALLADLLRDLDGQGVALDGIGKEDIDALLSIQQDVSMDAEELEDAADDMLLPQGDTDSVSGCVYELGPHRLICGDSTSADTWSSLLAGERWSLLVTSPPYAQQRDYGEAKQLVQDWDGLMCGVFLSAGQYAQDDGQMLVNLGMVHKDGEWTPYWEKWLTAMSQSGWRRFGMYVWDQGPGMPGDWGGRLAPSFELVFHMNRRTRRPNKTIEKLAENVSSAPHGTGVRSKDGTVKAWTSPDAFSGTHKIPDSVIRIMRHKQRGIETGHPAVFPVALPEFIIDAYTAAGDVVVEPFGGSGSTLIACAQSGRVCRIIELDPRYCDIIRKRWTAFAKKNGINAGSGALEASDAAS